MDWLFVLKEVLGWAIPLLCAGIMAVVLIPFKKAEKARNKGQEIIDQEEWDRHAVKLTQRIENLEIHHDDDKQGLEKEVQELKVHDSAVDDKLAQILELLKNNAESSKQRWAEMDAKNTAAFLQIYQRDLIVDGKMYIEHKRITPQQLANYEKRYKQYKDWGGNGDVEPWIKKIRELPIYYPTINDFNDK